MSRSTCFLVAMVPFLMLWVGATDGAPFLGLLSLLGSTSSSNDTNSTTSLLSTLALSHLQAKLTALSVISDLFAILGNVTASG